MSFDEELMERLKGLGRFVTKEELFGLSHKQLSFIMRATGGSSEEEKRSKEVMKERILYDPFARKPTCF